MAATTATALRTRHRQVRADCSRRAHGHWCCQKFPPVNLRTRHVTNVVRFETDMLTLPEPLARKKRRETATL